ncbi:hypothetical protein HPB49_023667 [Dermacentor silvarum]|uniref:Uncharacterized protein n=1 Tax=Dermacentor silvarum TaxID=543639 RepID=A0ACB8DLG1_DERSI|nr:hypothetical protein HPB49_023667 [Dermacentor silvarum]
MYARRSRYSVLLVLPSPGYCITIVRDCTSIVQQLLALSGDVESNPGPSTRSNSTQASCDIIAALEEIRSGQASLLNEMKSIRAKISKNEKLFDDIKMRLTKIEDDVSSITALKAEVSCVKTVVDKNTKAISDISSGLNDSEDRARRSNLMFFWRR